MGDPMQLGVARPMADTRGIEALLFDLGGVVLEIDFERVFRHWALRSKLSVDEIRARFSVDDTYQGHERGEIDAAGYFDHLRRLLRLEGSDAEIAAGWNAVFVGRIEPAITLVRQARRRLPCYCLTNTNPTHQTAWSGGYPELASLFDEIFVSSELGMRKPERRAYENVARRIGVDPGRVLFFDDLAQNIEGAKTAGMPGVLVRGPDDIREGLAAVAQL